MKRLFTFLLALMLTWIGASASTDLSSKLGNGESNWTSSNGNFADGRENYNGSGLSAGKLLYQTISGLTNGTYVVEFYAAVNNANSGSTPYGEDYAQVYANTTTKDITVGTLSGGNFGSTATTWGEEYHHTLLATVTNGTLEFGVQNVTAAGNWAIAVAESLTLIDSEWTGNATAHMCTTGGGSDNAAPTSWTSVNGNVFPGLHINKHSTEADASGMVTPFVEYWYGSTDAMVTPETLSHTQLTGLPEGEYTISVDARIMSESGATIGTGTTFNANGKSVDIDASGTEDTYGNETEVYGTYHLIAEVDDKGTLDISFSVPETVTYNWLAWKNLDIVYTGESLPTLEYVTGTMNKDIEAAMQAAVDAYNTSKSADDYAAALEAIDAAEASVAYYANVKDAIENELPTITLDDLGKAAWTNGSFLAAYNAQTLTNESVTAAFISAEASQAAGTELVYALTANEWICSTNGDGQGNGPSYMNPGYETYTGDSYVAGKVMYQRLIDLPDGYSYKVEFYGSAKSVNGGGNSVTGTGTAVAFANDKQQAVNIVSTPNSNDLLTGGYLRTFNMVTVDEDNALEYGLMNVATGGNWYMCDNYKITILGVVEDAIIGDATASATYVQPGQEVSITFEATAPSDDYTLVGSDFTSSEGISVTYSGEGVFTFTVPDDASGTFTVTIPAGQLYYTYSDEKVTNEEGSNAATTLTFNVAALTQTEGVYLKNLYGGDLLSRGKDYGTRADVDFVGLPLNLILQDDGRYVIQYADVDPNEASNNYLYGTAWAWADGEFTNSARIPTSFTVTEYTDSEGNTGYHFTSDYGLLYRYDATDANATDTEDDYALAVNGIQYPTDGYNYTYDTQAMWTIVSIAERDAIKAQWVADQKVAVAQDAGLTDINSGDEFDAYVATLAETLVESDAMESQGSWDAGTFTANGVETFQAVLRLNRTISGLDEGIYKVTLNGLERHADNAYCYQMYQDGYTDISNSYLVAGDYEINLKAWGTAAKYESNAYTPNDMSGAKELFDEGEYLNELYTYVGEDGELDINISLLTYDTWGWAQVKNLTLYRLGEDEYIYDVTKMLVNPSFEVDDPANDETATKDETRGNGETAGAWSVTSLTGWTLTAPTGGYAVCDLMTKDATATDNNFGVPGSPSDENYMLYLRNSHLSYEGTGTSASVMQDVTLPAGEYKFAVDSKCVSSGSAGTVSLVAGESSTALAIHSTSNGSEETKTNQFLNAWDTATLTFSLEEETKVTLGVNIAYNTSNDVALSVLLDNFRLYSEEDIVVWDMTEAMWGTLILPFAADVPSGLTAYSCDGLQDDDETLSLEEESTLASCTPYILNGTKGTYTFAGVPENETDKYQVGLLTGTLVDMTQGDFPTTGGTVYVLQNHPTEEGGAGVAFYPITSESTNVTLSAYHCYLTVSDGASGLRGFISFPSTGDATGIEAVESETLANGAIYDLSGRKVSKAVKGVYIMNGKKVMVK